MDDAKMRLKLYKILTDAECTLIDFYRAAWNLTQIIDIIINFW